MRVRSEESVNKSLYGKTKKYVNQFYRGEITEEQLWTKTNWNIVCCSHDVSNRRGATGHNIRQNIRHIYWDRIKEEYPRLQMFSIPRDVSGKTKATKGRPSF